MPISKIFHHTLAPNKVFFYQWGEYKYKICTEKNGFRIKCGSNSYKDFDIAFIENKIFFHINSFPLIKERENSTEPSCLVSFPRGFQIVLIINFNCQDLY